AVPWELWTVRRPAGNGLPHRDRLTARVQLGTRDELRSGTVEGDAIPRQDPRIEVGQPSPAATVDAAVPGGAQGRVATGRADVAGHRVDVAGAPAEIVVRRRTCCWAVIDLSVHSPAGGRI